jgi:hypothetical protein
VSPSIEAQRQAALLEAIRALDRHAPPGWLAPGGEHAPLAPYQGHVRALAPRVLSQAYPTVHAMLGDEMWPQVARQLWLSHPPHEGDLNRWGAALPDWLAAQDDLSAWPWLPDVARLDWACHDCAQAADAALDTASLEQLPLEDPDRLVIRLMPAMRIVNSAWPVVSLYRAHQAAEANDASPDDVLALTQQLLAAPQAECAIVTRPQWQAVVETLPAEWCDWMVALSSEDPISVGQALTRQAADFDLGAWLSCALQRHWIWRIELRTPED